MTLRTRLTVAVAVLVAASIAVSGALTVVTARGELVDEVDDFLRRRVDSLLVVDDLADDRRGRPIRPSALFFDQADAVTQVIGPDGSLRLEGQILLPIDDADTVIAARAGAPSRIRTVEVDGVGYRMITASLRGGGALQVARDFTEVQDALGGLTRRTIALVIVGSALAALVAWLLASRLSRPVAALTRAAEHVADTQDLSASIHIDDTGEVGRLAGSFNTMLRALDTSRRQQHRLVMDASHELRTPLTSLRTNVDLLRRASKLPDEDRAEIVDAVSDEVDELTSLVTELVELATESSRPEEPVVDVDLGRLAADVAERFRRRSGRSVSVTASGAAVVGVRVSALDRALSNLVDNALKFSPADSPVDIGVEGSKVLVRDRGPGIPLSDRDHVFDRFYRSTATRSLPGSGLGLAIVGEIVSGHGGRVFVEDPAEGPGVIVGFELPVNVPAG
jgi:two-component system sensor histidine kinase MprB